MTMKFLIVDDSRTVRAVLKRTLQMAGYDVSSVVEAGNGREALTALSADTFDVMLSDIHMPEMDGAELVERVRSDDSRRAMPIVVISSENTPERRAQMLALGAQSIMCKPFTAEGLRATLEGVCGGMKS